MAFDTALAARIREVLQPNEGITERKMFGGIAFMLDGHMVVGVIDSALMARVGPDAPAALYDQPHVRPMDFTGRPMRGFLYVDPPGIAEDAALQEWIDRCLAFVRTLPPKEPKPAKTAGTRRKPKR